MQDFSFGEEFFDISDCDIDFDLTETTSSEFSDYDKKRVSCSFTGHRNLSDDEKKTLLPSLKSTILYLISQGVKEFHCGGALGFDTLAATVVFDISRQHDDIKLILELPYENQASGWKENDRRIYDFLKTKADEINIHGKNPTSKEQAVKLLLMRNRVLIDKSHYCVCYHRKNSGGTAYTVNYAKLHDVQIINLAE